MLTRARAAALALSIAILCAASFSASASATDFPIQMASGPGEGTVVNTQINVFKWTVGGNPGHGFMYSCAIDGVTYSCTEASGFTAALLDGDHAVTIQGFFTGFDGVNVFTDMAGPIAVNFTIDSTPPVLGFASGPAQGTTVSGGDVSFGLSGESGLKISCSLDGGAAVDCTSGIAYKGLTTGLHGVLASSTDTAGNTSTVSRVFAVGSVAGKTKKTIKFCYRAKLTRNGKVLRTKSGKLRYRKICRRVTITY